MSGVTGSEPGDAVSFPYTETPGRGGLGPVRRFAEIDSTNLHLVGAARAGAPAGLVAVADHQTAGRGRLGRRWEAPAAVNLLCSVLLRPRLPADALHLCTVAVALAGADACLELAGLQADLKWPNDLVVADRKLAGVLAELVTGPSGPAVPDGPAMPDGPAVVVGIGLNLGWPPERTDPSGPAGATGESGAAGGLLAPATSVRAETGQAPTPDAALDALLEALGGRLAALDDPDGRLRLAGEHRRRCVTVGRTVRVELADEIFTGNAADVTVEGHLLVDVGACLRAVTAGDVVHLRPAT